MWSVLLLKTAIQKTFGLMLEQDNYLFYVFYNRPLQVGLAGYIIQLTVILI